MIMTVKALETTVLDFIRTHALLAADNILLVALSGGADSVALLLSLCRLGYRVEAVHCNFHLRGDESDRDEHFCRQLCDDRHIAFHVAHFDTLSYAVLHHVSIEMAARELRYRYFEQLRRDIGAADICVAHHRDDQVETVLINFVRGTGLHGLTGMAPRRDHIVRPLLCVGRADIEAYLHALGQSYVTDSTNLIDDVTRNKFRLDIIPKLRTINPSVTNSIAHTALRLAEAEKVFDRALRDGASRVSTVSGNSVRIDINRLKTEPSPEYLLFFILQPLGFSSSQIEQIHARITSSTGREWCSSTHQLLLDRGSVLVEPLSEPVRPVRMPEEGIYVVSADERMKLQSVACGEDFQVLKDHRVACLDARRVVFPLILRLVEEGDRFMPFGMKGTKLVSDYLTDRKFSLFAKRRQRVLTDAQGHILWLVGERPDARYCITPATTCCLMVSLETTL